MTNTWGEWFYTPELPAESDMDKVAKLVMDTGYEIKTELEHLCEMILAFFYDWEEEVGLTGLDDFIQKVETFIIESGGLREFDYYC